MSSHEGAANGRQRAPLRAATLILPRTGERLRQAVTFRPSLGGQTDGSRSAGPESPLLPASARRRSRRKSGPPRAPSVTSKLKRRAQLARAFVTSKAGIGIFKCSLAYLLGSMGTFFPPLAAWLGNHGGKHMIATVTVYFHPARSLGSAFEAVACAAVAFAYATCVSFLSMWVSVLFGDHLHMMSLGHAIVLIVFCGGGLGFVGWTKLAMDRPLVNVACSLASLIIITVLTKEGSVQAADFSPVKIVQVLKIVTLGVLFTTVVGITILPISARRELRVDLRHLTDSLGDMLAMITNGFLLGSEDELEKRGFQEAVDRHKACFKSLTKNLKEAKWEHYVLGTENEYRLEKKIVDCTRRMAQNLGGLRSAATTQFALLLQPAMAGGSTPATSIMAPSTAGLTGTLSRADSWLSVSETPTILERIEESPHEGEQQTDDTQGYAPTVRHPTEIFEKFIMELGPSMKSLAFTLKLILDELPYGPGPDFKIADHEQFQTSLSEALTMFKDKRKEALTLLYKTKELSVARPLAVEADFEEVAASCGYFSFSLQDFADDIQEYLETLDELKTEVETPKSARRSWNWLKFWRYLRSTERSKDSEGSDPEQVNLVTPNGTANEVASEQSPTLENSHDSLKRPMGFQEPGQTFNHRVWKSLSCFRRDDTKFAIKVGIGAALYALPSFLEETRGFYLEWRGNWGLLSYMLVCSMTIGASNTTGFARTFGTCLGAVQAIVAWVVSRGNVYALAILGWLACIPSFYLIVAKGQGPFGRFVLLTYNLSALYAYTVSVSQNAGGDEEDANHLPLIGPIALHRVVAVMSGCLWGLFITRLVWPISAREKFRQGLSLLLLRMGLIWKRDPLNALLHDANDVALAHPYLELDEGVQMQKFFTRLEATRTSASYEFELKAPFPGAAYGRALRSVGRMLDAFHAMHEIIRKEPRASAGEAEILRATAAERDQLCARISHLFQVLASSIKLEFPLTDALPSTDHARDRLLARVFKIRKEMRMRQRLDDEDFGLLYAFALVTGQLSKELREVGQVVETLFGVLDEDVLKLQ